MGDGQGEVSPPALDDTTRQQPADRPMEQADLSRQIWESQRLDYQHHGSPEAVQLAAGEMRADRVEFRRECQQQLNAIFRDLEGARDKMVAVHEFASQGFGPDTQHFQTNLEHARIHYQRAIQAAEQALYTRDAEGNLQPNARYRAIEQERVQLQQEMRAARESNPQEYARLMEQHDMLQDLLRSAGYAHANYGLALLRSSVYLSGDARNQQEREGHEKLGRASQLDRWMWGNPPAVEPDPNWMRHFNRVMSIVQNTPRDGGPQPVEPGPQPGDRTPETPDRPAPQTQTAELPPGIRVERGRMFGEDQDRLLIFDGKRILPTGNRILEPTADGRPSEHDPFEAMRRGNFRQAIDRADDLDRVALATAIHQLAEASPDGKLVPRVLRQITEREQAILNDNNHPLHARMRNYDQQRQTQAAAQAEVGRLFEAGQPTTEQWQAFEHLWQQLNAVEPAQRREALNRLLNDPQNAQLKQQVEGHANWNAIKSKLEEVYNQDEILHRLEQEMAREHQDGRTLAQMRTQLAVDAQNLPVLLEYYRSSISVRLAELQAMGDQQGAQADARRRELVSQLAELFEPQHIPQSIRDAMQQLGIAVDQTANQQPGQQPEQPGQQPEQPGDVGRDSTPEVVEPAAAAQELAPVRQQLELAVQGFKTADLLLQFAREVRRLENEHKDNPDDLRTAIRQLQANVFGESGHHLSVASRPNLAQDIRLNEQGDQFVSLPADIRERLGLDQAYAYIRDINPEQFTAQIESLRRQTQQQLDAVVPQEQQQALIDEFRRLEHTRDQALSMLSPQERLEYERAVQQSLLWSQQLQMTVIATVQQDPEYQRQLQEIMQRHGDNPQNAEAEVIQLQDNFIQRVVQSQQYQALVAQVNEAEQQLIANLERMNPAAMSSLTAAENAINRFAQGMDSQGRPNEQMARQVQTVMMFLNNQKQIDELSHAPALVRSFYARALVTFDQPEDHRLAARLMTEAANDPDAARFIGHTLNPAVGQALVDSGMGSAAASVSMNILGIPGEGYAWSHVTPLVSRVTGGAVFGELGRARDVAVVQTAAGLANDPSRSEQVEQQSSSLWSLGVDFVRDALAIGAGYGANRGLTRWIPNPYVRFGVSLFAAGAVRDATDGQIGDITDWARGAGGYTATRGALHLMRPAALTAEQQALLGTRAATTPHTWAAARTLGEGTHRWMAFNGSINPLNWSPGLYTRSVGNFFNPRNLSPSHVWQPLAAGGEQAALQTSARLYAHLGQRAFLTGGAWNTSMGLLQMTDGTRPVPGTMGEWGTTLGTDFATGGAVSAFGFPLMARFTAHLARPVTNRLASTALVQRITPEAGIAAYNLTRVGYISGGAAGDRLATSAAMSSVLEDAQDVNALARSLQAVNRHWTPDQALAHAHFMFQQRQAALLEQQGR